MTAMRVVQAAEVSDGIWPVQDQAPFTPFLITRRLRL